MKTWWASFCDISKPKGSQFLGVIIMDGCTVIEAHIKINRYGINPGGEIMFFDVTEAAHKINAADKNRLLTKEEAERIGDEDESVCQNS